MHGGSKTKTRDFKPRFRGSGGQILTRFAYEPYVACALRDARPIDPVLSPPSSWRTLTQAEAINRDGPVVEKGTPLRRARLIRTGSGRSTGARRVTSRVHGIRHAHRPTHRTPRPEPPRDVPRRAMSAALGARPAWSPTRVSASPRVVRARRADRRRGPPSRSAVGATTPRDPPSRAPRPSPSPAARFHIPVSRLTRSSLASHPLLTSPARLVSPRSRPEGLPRLRARHR